MTRYICCYRQPTTPTLSSYFLVDGAGVRAGSIQHDSLEGLLAKTAEYKVEVNEEQVPQDVLKRVQEQYALCSCIYAVSASEIAKAKTLAKDMKLKATFK